MNGNATHRLPWGPFSIAFFGLAFARAWVSLAFVVEPVDGAYSPLSHGLFDIGYIGCGLVVFVLARWLVPYAGRCWTFPATLAGMLVASLAFSLQPVAPPVLAAAVLPVAAVIGGVAFASCSFLNAEMLSGVSTLRIALYISGNNVLGSVLVFFLGGGDGIHLSAAVLALPVVAVALIRGAWGSLPESDRPRARYPRFEFPWKLMGLLALFSFVYGLRSEALAAGAGRHSSLSTLLVAGAVFIAAYFLPGRFDVAKLCRAPLPLMLCGILLLPAEGLVGQVVASYLVAMGFTLMKFLVGLLVYDMCKRTGVAVLPLVAAESAVQVFMLAGESLSGFLGASMDEGGGAATAIIVCVALAGAFFLLFSERELTERWGVRVLAHGSLEEGDRRDTDLLAKCAELSRAYRLTPREEEVLREFACKKSSKAIMRNLVIAPGTLKAHTRHIYEKMGIHTRAELYGLLGLDDGGMRD